MTIAARTWTMSGTCSRQDLGDLLAAAQVLGRRAVGLQAAEVDDALDARVARRLAEVVRRPRGRARRSSPSPPRPIEWTR